MNSFAGNTLLKCGGLTVKLFALNVVKKVHTDIATLNFTSANHSYAKTDSALPLGVFMRILKYPLANGL